VQFADTAAIVAAVLVATAIAALLSANVPDTAGPTGIVWTWQAPSGCPDEETTRRELAAATRTACTLAANAKVLRTAAGWRLDLELGLRGRRSARTLTGATCRALADAAIVIVTVACTEDASLSDPSVEPTSAAQAEAPAPAVDPPIVPSPIEPAPMATVRTIDEVAPRRASARIVPPAAPARRTRKPPIAELGLRGGVAWAPTPAPAALLGLALRLRWARIDVVLSGAYTSARTERYAEQPTLGVTTRLAHMGLAVCPALEWGRGLGRGRGALCAELAAGAMFGSGVGAPSNVTRARPWLGADLGPTLAWLPHPRISLGLAVDLLVSVVRPAFELEGLAPLVRAAPFGVRIHTTIFVRLF